MDGSEWPVCLLAFEFTIVKKTMEQILGKIQKQMHANVLRDMATNFYQLNLKLVFLKNC